MTNWCDIIEASTGVSAPGKWYRDKDGELVYTNDPKRAKTEGFKEVKNQKKHEIQSLGQAK